MLESRIRRSIAKFDPHNLHGQDLDQESATHRQRGALSLVPKANSHATMNPTEWPPFLTREKGTALPSFSPLFSTLPCIHPPHLVSFSLYNQVGGTQGWSWGANHLGWGEEKRVKSLIIRATIRGLICPNVACEFLFPLKLNKHYSILTYYGESHLKTPPPQKKSKKDHLYYWNNVYTYKWNMAGFFYQPKGDLGLQNKPLSWILTSSLTINNKYIFWRRLALWPGALCIPSWAVSPGPAAEDEIDLHGGGFAFGPFLLSRSQSSL